MSEAERRAWRGPAVLEYGFRPLFLVAGVWATVAMAMWIAMLAGLWMPPTALAPVDWHVHGLLYGFIPAVMAGFLLTALPNWTGRPPVVGWPLFGLVAVWLAGRILMTISALVRPGLASAADLLFLALLVGLVGREIVAADNRRNLPALGALALLWLGNLAFHLDASGGAAARGWGARLGVAVAVFMIVLIGGRIVPSFTRNWLAARGRGPLPAAMDRFDAAAVVIAGVVLLTWVAAPESAAGAAICLVAAAVHAARLGRWGGWRTGSEPLVSVLHVGYGFVPLGFLLVALSIVWPGLLFQGAALHAWTAGAAGVMTLAVMTRASLGHTGRALTADRWMTAIYAAAVAAALLRVASGFVPGSLVLIYLSAGLWIAAFGGFSVAFFGVLTRPRATPKGASR